MALDPRLDALAQYAASELGAGPTDELAALRQEIADLKRIVGVLLRTPLIQTVSGTPTQAARDGTPALDLSQPRFWLRRNGAWQFTTLT